MTELPEAVTVAGQINSILNGKKVKAVTANASPHSFAWFYGDPSYYATLLTGGTVKSAQAYGGHIEICFDDARLVFCDGANPRFLKTGAARPKKHQLLLEFEDGSALVCAVQMYGGLWAFRNGEFDNEYFRVAREKPSPLTNSFSSSYFDSLRIEAGGKASVKALLATEQRIPGLGNGVLQDILYTAHINPKRRIGELSDVDFERLYTSVKEVLSCMTKLGGRDVERDLLGQPGGYVTKCSRLTVDRPCPVCGGIIRKDAYMGGAVYYCPGCQKTG